MQISTLTPTVVCIFPFKINGLKPTAFEDRQLEGWSASEWEKYFPRQFRQSYPSMRFIDRFLDLPVDARFGEASELLANGRTVLALFDDHIGCLMLVMDAEAETLTEVNAARIYSGMVTFKECHAEGLTNGELLKRGFGQDFRLELTWTFSINIAFVSQGGPPPETIGTAFHVICNESPGRYTELAAPQQANTIRHVSGSTGSLCIIPSSNAPNFSFDRVLSLWMIFYTYSSISMREYVALARENKDRGRSVIGSDATEILNYHQDRYHRLTSLIHIFDPINICTRGFDYEVYEDCWKNNEMESLSIKLRELSMFFIESAKEARAEITRRYEGFMQLLISIITFTQLVPFVNEGLKMAPWAKSYANDFWATLASLLAFFAVFWFARWRSMSR
jgi:hypothetical protein